MNYLKILFKKSLIKYKYSNNLIKFYINYYLKNMKSINFLKRRNSLKISFMNLNILNIFYRSFYFFFDWKFFGAHFYINFLIFINFLILFKLSFQKHFIKYK